MQRRKFIQKTLQALPAVLAVPTVLTAGCGDKSGDKKGKSVLVIGAGIAGLAAARMLQEEGLQVTVIEAQEKVGGRLRTDRSLGVPFDEGASWIHGPKGNPIADLANQAGAKTFLTNDDQLTIFDRDGKAYTDAVVDAAYEDYEAALEAVRKNGDPNRSFQTVFNQRFPQYADQRLWKYMLSAYLEFDTGSDIADLSSVDFDDDEVFRGDDVIITNGYDTIANHLAKGLTVRLKERATKIDYTAQPVQITTDLGAYTADYVVVAVPLGILKKGNIAFAPALPANHQQAIQRLKMSAVNKFLLTWDKAFWDTSLQYIGFTPDTKGKFNYFLNVQKFVSAPPALMTFAFGNYGAQTESMSDAAVTDAIMAHLRAIYGASVPNPNRMLRTKWASNPFTYGAYSFATSGARTADFDLLAQPINQRLFFAGEHTNRAYRGTVHGAYLSGQRAAEEILG